MFVKEQIRQMGFNLLIIIGFFSFVLAGFISTPSMFHIINYEYKEFVPQIILRRDVLQREIADLRIELQALVKEGISLGFDVDVRSDSYYTSETRRASSFAVAASSASLEDFLSSQDASAVKSDKQQAKMLKAEKIQNLKNRVNINYASTQSKYDDIADLNREISKYSSDSNNVYLVTRALALGSLGALANLLSRRALVNQALDLDRRKDKKAFLSSIIIGAIVSVVAFGLFYTKQITIFHNESVATSLPDYWRTTILCLIAGAFADRLYSAASERIDQYVGKDEGRVKPH